MDRGTFTLGAFCLRRMLGRGGMAEVWYATHPDVAEAVALKVMLSHAAASPMLRDAFLSEARSHAGLDSPHVVRLLDLGEVRAEDLPPQGVTAGDPYLIMELADGTCRDDSLPSTWGELQALLLQILDGLAYSHARGLIHRDLKPENVLRFGEHEPTYKLADFGIAHSVRALDETADRSSLSITVGTPHYMAPEQFRGHWYDFGPPTDLYALGVLAYELACGRVPFAQTNLYAIVNSHLTEPIPALRPRLDVPAGFEAWIARLTQKRPGDRFQFAADAAHALRQLGLGYAAASRASSAAAEAPAAPTLLLDEETTLVDALSDLITAETMDALEAGAVPGEAPALADSPALPPVEPAPIAPRWSEPVIGTQLGLGLGLLPLRDVPLVGQHSVRNALWEALAEAATLEGPRVVLLRGGERAPVNPIVSWLARQAAWSAAARVHEVFYTRAGAPREGLVALLEDLFGTWGMTDAEAAQRIERCVGQWVEPELAASCTSIASAIVLAARGADVTHPTTLGERFRAIGELLEATAAQRPYLAAFTDTQWGRDPFAFAMRLAERRRPGLVILGVVDGTTIDPNVEHQLEELAQLPHVRVIEVPAQTPAEQLEALTRLLPFEPTAARRVLTVTQGEEVPIRLLLGQLGSGGELHRTPEGYRIPPQAPVPTTRAEIFATATASCVNRRPAALPALEIAAALGRAPDAAELEAVCNALGVDATGLPALLAEHGLARNVGPRWWFVHDGVVAVLAQTARARGVWERVNLVCAEVLAARARRDDPEVLERAARHFLAAGEPRRALDPLARAMRALLGRDLPRAQGLAEEYDALCEELALPPTDPARVDGAIARMVILRAAGDLDASEALAERSVQLAREIGHHVGQAFALRHLARLAGRKLDLATAIELATAAEAAAVTAGDLREQGTCARTLGELHEAAGDFSPAIRALTRAVDLYRAAGEASEEVAAMSTLASVLAYAGQVDEAAHWGEEAMQAALSAGSASVGEISSTLGDIARMKGDHRRAREHYLDARTRFMFGAPANRSIVELNLALLDIAESRWESAEEAFGSLIAPLAAAGLHDVVAVARAGAAACAAVRGDVVALAAHLEAIRVVPLDSLHPDAVWALEVGERETVRREAKDLLAAALSAP